MNDSYRSIIKDSRLHFPPRPKVSLVLFRASCRETPLPVALQNALPSLVQHRIIIVRFHPQDSSKFQRSHEYFGTHLQPRSHVRRRLASKVERRVTPSYVDCVHMAPVLGRRLVSLDEPSSTPCYTSNLQNITLQAP